MTASSAAATRSTTAQTWTEIGDGFDTAGLGAPSIGLAAYNGTGSETGTFEAFTVGEPPELPPVPPCETPNTPEAGYTMLFDGTDASSQQLEVLGQRPLRPRGLHDQVRRRVRPACTPSRTYKAPYSLKLDWMMPGDDNSGIFVGFPDTGANTVDTSINNGEEIQIDPTDNPAQTTGAIYLEQAADAAARDAALKPAGQWNSYELIVKADRIIVILNGVKINEWIDDDPVVGSGATATSACRCTARATTSSSATCASRTCPRRCCATRPRPRWPIRRSSRSAAAAR